MTAESELLYALGYCAFILILFLIFRRFPPGKVNHFYGYRTRKSMRNQDTWEEAQKYSFAILFRLSLYCFAFPPVLYFIYPEENFLITVIANTLLIIASLWFTEKHLDRVFDKSGHRK